MKSFFLIFLLLYLSVFPPPASSVPLVEIIEEELVVHSQIPVKIIILVTEREFFSDFPEQLTLTPQSMPHPELRPPAYRPLLFV